MVVLGKKSWFRLIIAYRGSVLPRIWLRLVVTLVAAVAVTFLRPEGLLLGTSLTVLPFTLIGLPLGIFLGFRNNTSYDRFWEGRKLWGGVVNATRTLARRILTMVSAADHSPPSAEHLDLVYRVIAYAHCLRLHLRDDANNTELVPFLPASEVEALKAEANRPIAILQGLGDRFSNAWREGRVDSLHLPTLEEGLTELTNLQGGCERIKNTPIPFSYTVLIHRIVAFYCFALPFGIAETVGAMTPLVVFLVSYAFFGLDAIGDEIEEPFGLDPNDLPLTQITTMIEANLRQRLGELELPAMPIAENGVVC